MVHGKMLRPIDEVLKEIKFDIKQFPGYGNINKKNKRLKKNMWYWRGCFLLITQR